MQPTKGKGEENEKNYAVVLEVTDMLNRFLISVNYFMGNKGKSILRKT